MRYDGKAGDQDLQARRPACNSPVGARTRKRGCHETQRGERCGGHRLPAARESLVRTPADGRVRCLSLSVLLSLSAVRGRTAYAESRMPSLKSLATFWTGSFVSMLIALPRPTLGQAPDTSAMTTLDPVSVTATRNFAP